MDPKGISCFTPSCFHPPFTLTSLSGIHRRPLFHWIIIHEANKPIHATTVLSEGLCDSSPSPTGANNERSAVKERLEQGQHIEPPSGHEESGGQKRKSKNGEKATWQGWHQRRIQQVVDDTGEQPRPGHCWRRGRESTGHPQVIGIESVSYGKPKDVQQQEPEGVTTEQLPNWAWVRPQCQYQEQGTVHRQQVKPCQKQSPLRERQRKMKQRRWTA